MPGQHLALPVQLGRGRDLRWRQVCGHFRGKVQKGWQCYRPLNQQQSLQARGSTDGSVGEIIDERGHLIIAIGRPLAVAVPAQIRCNHVPIRRIIVLRPNPSFGNGPFRRQQDNGGASLLPQSA